MKSRAFSVGPVWVLPLALILAGCPETFPEEPPPAVEPASISVAGGQGQEAQVGTQLADPVVALVEGTDDQPMAGVTVTWSVTSGGGSVSSSSTTTDAEGRAQTAWTLGTTAGEQRVSGQVQGVSTAAQFTANATPGSTAEVTVSPSSLTFDGIGQTETVTAASEDEFGNTTSGTVSWSSSNTSVATVNTNGVVTSQGGGTAEIRATVDGVMGTASVTVDLPIQSITIAPSSVTFDAFGQTETMTAEARDANGSIVSGTSFDWSSSNTAVATVDGSGVVTAQGNGSANITASAAGVTSNGASVSVDQAVAALTVTPGFITLSPGGSGALEVNAEDSNGNPVSSPSLTTTSRSTAVASASGTQVSGVAVGVTDVVVTSDGASDSARVAVVEADGFAFLATPDIDRAVVTASDDGTFVVELWLVRPADGTGGLGSISGTLEWDPAVLEYQSSEGVASGFSWTANENEVAAGELGFGSFAAEGIEDSFVVASVTFSVVGGVGTESGLNLSVSAAGDATGSTNIAALIQTVSGHVRIEQ